jgi:D-glycero-alpha-D-manno-heptose 1-phosphate guanylyltransferase
MLRDELPASEPDASGLDCVILAGGLGTRLQGVVSDRPKSMALVGGRPFLELLILALKQQGLSRFVFATGHRGEQIEAHFGRGDWAGTRITCSHESEPLGTGGALRLALGHLKASRVLVLNGDSYCRLEVAALLRTHVRAGAEITLQLARVDDRGRYGTVLMDAGGVVTSFGEKSQKGPGWVSAGVYVFQRAVLDALPPQVPMSIETDLIPRYVGRGLHAVGIPGPFIDIGTPDAYRTASTVVARV